jgi:hypothetical protein
MGMSLTVKLKHQKDTHDHETNGTSNGNGGHLVPPRVNRRFSFHFHHVKPYIPDAQACKSAWKKRSVIQFATASCYQGDKASACVFISVKTRAELAVCFPSSVPDGH